MTGAQLVVQALKQHGITQVFGYPGGAIMPLYDALYDGGVHHQLCRHEQGAGTAAIGYARSTGKVGACIATSGPGLTNLVTSLAEAQLDSIPLVAFSGQVPRALMGTDAFQEVDVIGLSLACTKHSFVVEDPNELAAIIEQAFTIATSGRPGPVLIDIPKDIQMMAVEYQPQRAEAPAIQTLDTNAIEQAKRLIAAAKKPMLYIGGGAGAADAIGELRDFIQQSHIPSVCTLKGLGSVCPSTEGYLGMLGMHGTKAANLAVHDCDLLIVVGARFDDRVTGKLDEFAADAKVIHLDIDVSEFGKRRMPDLAISTDLKLVLPALTTELNIDAWINECIRLKKEHAFDYDFPGDSIYAPKLLNRLSQLKDQSAFLTSDVGQHQMWVAQHMSFNHPTQHISSSGLGTMGFGLPAAIGAQMANPDSQVLMVTGDGSFMMNIQELGTIKRANLPIKIVLIDNQRLGMVRQWQELFFDKRYSETILDDNPDFVTLASAFGIKGESINKGKQVEGALQRLLNSEGAYLLHVEIDSLDNVWPLVPPGAANNKMLERCE